MEFLKPSAFMYEYVLLLYCAQLKLTILIISNKLLINSNKYGGRIWPSSNFILFVPMEMHCHSIHLAH